MAKKVSKKFVPKVNEEVTELADESLDGSYKATLKLYGKYFSATGTTLSKAIENLSIKNGKGVSILAIEKDGKHQEKIFMPPVTARLFGPTSGLVKQIILKQACERFSL